MKQVEKLEKYLNLVLALSLKLISWEEFQKQVKTLGMICLLIIALTGCGKAKPPITRVVAIGDSITYGCGELFGTTNDNYPEIVAHALGVPVVNLAVRGIRLDEMLPLAKDFQFAETDLVLFQPGMNDLLQRKDSRLDEYVAELKEMLTLLTEAKAQVYAGTTTRSLSGNNQLNALYAQILRDVVEEDFEDVTVVETHSWEPKPEFLFDDIHPNNEGQNQLAGIYLEAIYENE